jgi:hypothetical protein
VKFPGDQDVWFIIDNELGGISLGPQVWQIGFGGSIRGGISLVAAGDEKYAEDKKVKKNSHGLILKNKGFNE